MRHQPSDYISKPYTSSFALLTSRKGRVRDGRWKREDVEFGKFGKGVFCIQSTQTFCSQRTECGNNGLNKISSGDDSKQEGRDFHIVVSETTTPTARETAIFFLFFSSKKKERIKIMRKIVCRWMLLISENCWEKWRRGKSSWSKFRLFYGTSIFDLNMSVALKCTELQYPNELKRNTISFWFLQGQVRLILENISEDEKSHACVIRCCLKKGAPRPSHPCRQLIFTIDWQTSQAADSLISCCVTIHKSWHIHRRITVSIAILLM